MKKNAVLIAGIMFAAGCASSQGQRASYNYNSPTDYHRADISVSGTDHVVRDSRQVIIPPTDVDVSDVISHDSSVGTYGESVSARSSSENRNFRADSSLRGGSLDARGYDQAANSDELEGSPHSINPGKQADSSIRGGSVFAREKEWNENMEPSSRYGSQSHLKADSSIRGGSLEARGGREARDQSRSDFGQGSSATWESDKGHGSVRGSANWNPSDDLMRDGISSESDSSSSSYEFNNDASVGGAARSESGEGSSELQSQELLRFNSDLNSSEQLESNISGDIDLEKQSELESGSQAQSTDTLTSSSSSERTTDIHHDEADLTAVEEDVDIEAAGSAASSESGTFSSSEESNSDDFQSNDPAMNKLGSPLGTSGGEPNFLYNDNRAQGVGSAATGEFATSDVNRGGSLQMSNDELARKVKATLTSESTGTHGLMAHQVARNVQVTADNGEITLSGTVPSEQDRGLIEVRAREITGVKRVNNELTVASGTSSSERSISRGSDLEDVTSELQD